MKKFHVTFGVLSTLAISFSCGFGKTASKSDKDAILHTLGCFQQAITSGIPSINLPSYDPYRIYKNFSFSIPMYTYRLDMSLKNMTVKEIPKWKVLKLNQIRSEGDDNLVFDYTLYWESLIFGGNWRGKLMVKEIETKVFEDVGVLIYEMDNVTISGRFNFSKTGEDKGFQELTQLLHTVESELYIDGLGLFSDLITYNGGFAMREFMNLNLFADLLNSALRNELNANWVFKPARVQAVLDICNKTVL